MKTSGNAQHTAIDMRAKFTPAEVISVSVLGITGCSLPELLLWIEYLNCVGIISKTIANEDHV